MNPLTSGKNGKLSKSVALQPFVNFRGRPEPKISEVPRVADDEHKPDSRVVLHFVDPDVPNYPFVSQKRRFDSILSMCAKTIRSRDRPLFQILTDFKSRAFPVSSESATPSIRSPRNSSFYQAVMFPSRVGREHASHTRHRSFSSASSRARTKQRCHCPSSPPSHTSNRRLPHSLTRELAATSRASSYLLHRFSNLLNDRNACAAYPKSKRLALLLSISIPQVIFNVTAIRV